MKRSQLKHNACRITKPSYIMQYGQQQNVVVKERKRKYFHIRILRANSKKIGIDEGLTFQISISNFF